MAYTLKSNKAEFKGGKNILASSIVQYVHGGATFDATKFDKGLVEVGTLVARNKETGKYEPFSVVEGYDNFFVLNEDHDHDGETDFVSGAVIIRGSVYEAKLPQEVPAEFKQANPNIFYVTHIEG